MTADGKALTSERPRAASGLSWAPTVELRFRKVNFGRPVLQQLWRAGKGEKEWRDVPEEAVE